MIQCEENPFPDGEVPFVLFRYLPVAREIFGEPNSTLLEDNQNITGALMRGAIDLLAKSANSQTGIAKGALDKLNKSRLDKGMDYEFNMNVDPRMAIFQHTFPELPQSVLTMLQIQQSEAEAISGIRAFATSAVDSNQQQVAAQVRGALDAASKREMGILRRIIDGMIKVARKIIAMNALWLNDSEIIRITNQDFVEIHRDDLAGNFDLEIDISTNEQDDVKAQELAFMLQTLGQDMDTPMRNLILSGIAKLRKMPELAERVRRFTPPPPDPMQQKLQEMQIELLQAQIEKLHAEAGKSEADTQLSNAKAQSEIYGTQLDMQLRPQELLSKIQSEQAKAQYNQSMAQKLNLDYLNDIQGTKHKQDMELMAQQAKAQADKSMQEKFMDYMIEQEKTKQSQNKKGTKK